MKDTSRSNRCFVSVLLGTLVILLLPSKSWAQDRMTSEQLFQTDRVVDVQIRIAEEDWDTICKQTREFADVLTKKPVVSPFEYVKGDVTVDGLEIKNVGIRKKGFLGSLDLKRPSLKIKFAEYQDQDPIDGVDRLTLNNNKQDPSRVCQYLSYKLFRDSGTHAPRCGFAKVSVNGKSLGVYSNVESIKPLFLKRSFGDGGGDCFEGQLADFFLDWTQKFEKKNKQAKQKDLKAIAVVMDQEKLDLEQLEKYVDIDAFIKYWAMESLIGFWDSYCSNQNNFFIYQNPGNSKFYFIPWGTDSCFTKRSPIPPYQIVPASVHAKAILPNRLYRIPAIQEKYLATLDSFIEQHWNEDKLLAEMDRVEKLLDEHLLESNRKPSKRTWNGFRRFVKTRAEDFAKERKDGPPKLKSREKKPVYFSELGEAEISFTTKWFKKTPAKKQGLGQAELKLTINGELVEIEDLTAYAERSQWPGPGGAKPATVVFVGKRKSDGKRVTLATSFSDEQFVDGMKGAKAGGIYFIDNAFFGVDGMQMIGGTATFEKASIEDGETIKGKMKLRIRKMKMGEARK